jgi:hypothetical protein
MLRPLELWETRENEMCGNCTWYPVAGMRKIDGSDMKVCRTCSERYDLYEALPRDDVKVTVLSKSGVPVFSSYVRYLHPSGIFFEFGNEGVELQGSIGYDPTSFKFALPWEDLAARTVERDGESYSYKYPLSDGCFLRIEQHEFPKTLVESLHRNIKL